MTVHEALVAINPATGLTIARYPVLSIEEIETRIAGCHQAHQSWSVVQLAQRAEILQQLAHQLERQRDQLAALMTGEMGKPLSQACSEIDKCAWVCRYFAESGEHYLQADDIQLDGAVASVVPRPLGVVLAIMPWNFPFWQVFRALAPALMVGNGVLLKGASNVPGCSEAIAQLLASLDIPTGLLTNLPIHTTEVERVIAHPLVRGVTLTGSESAGRAVAALAGSHLKKCVLELGGQDPYLVFEDADLTLAAQKCVQSRMLCSGQVCIAAKRLIVVDSIYDAFRCEVIKQLKPFSLSDPTDQGCRLGPLAREDLRDQVHAQVVASIAAGCRLLQGGVIPDQPGWWYPATVLEGAGPGTPAFDDEVFGPVVTLIRASDEKEALNLAAMSRFGLGAAIFTAREDHARRLASECIESGSIAINDFVKSDPRVPFGGMKDSGFGRELGRLGMQEFVNYKSIVCPV